MVIRSQSQPWKWPYFNGFFRGSLNCHFPNLEISQETREDFLLRHAKGKYIDRASVVIFTGKSHNALKLQAIFGKQVLFIGNGASHNPVVVADGCDLHKAVEGVMAVQLYNQGEDCAAPNSILVERTVYDTFLEILRHKARDVVCGPYKQEDALVGPISDKNHITEVIRMLQKSGEFIDRSTPGLLNIRHSIIEPTIITRPLITGGWFKEWYAPIFTLQSYDSDGDLHSYFEDPRYGPHAGYITLFGESSYVHGLVKGSNPNHLHDESTLILNTHLHAPGVERGTKPYGGFGKNSSFIAVNGKREAKPTLPLSDIYEYEVFRESHDLRS